MPYSSSIDSATKKIPSEQHKSIRKEMRKETRNKMKITGVQLIPFILKMKKALENGIPRMNGSRRRNENKEKEEWKEKKYKYI